MIPHKDLKDDLVRVSNKIGRAPTVIEYSTHGEYSSRTIKNRLGDGSWKTALESVGADTSQRRHSGKTKIPEKKLQQDVEQVAKELGHPPTMTEYTQHGNHGHTTICNRFGDGSWTDALEQLGYNTSREK